MSFFDFISDFTSGFLDLEDNFTQLMVACTIGAVIFMAVSICHRKRQVLQDLPSKNIHIPKGYTAKDLEIYDGTQHPCIFMGCKGIIYNVSREWYGPSSPYNAFAGKESSRQLGKVIVGTEECNADWTTLSPDHLQALNEWEEKFKSKYIPVGWFLPDADYYEKGKHFCP